MNEDERMARALSIAHGFDPEEPVTSDVLWVVQGITKMPRHTLPAWQAFLSEAHRILKALDTLNA